MDFPAHTKNVLDAEMNEVRDRLSAMSKRCRVQLALALHSFWARSKDEAAEVEALDDAVDDDERAIDELILRILALRQPVASDLRMLAACLKLVTDLERIGDGAVNIADAGAHRGDGGLDSETLHRLAVATEAIVGAATASFIEGNERAADDVDRAHAAIETLHAALTDEMLGVASSHPDAARSVVAAMNAGRALERISDHAANIAEGTRFVLRDEPMPR